jgi:hypothetical protein
VKADTEEERQNELDETIITAVRDHRDNPGYSDDYIDVFDFPQTELDSGYWSLMPPEEFQVIDRLEQKSTDTVGGITDSVFAGTQTSATMFFLLRQ